MRVKEKRISPNLRTTIGNSKKMVTKKSKIDITLVFTNNCQILLIVLIYFQKQEMVNSYIQCKTCFHIFQKNYSFCTRISIKTVMLYKSRYLLKLSLIQE